MTTLVELTALTKAQLIDKMLEGVTETVPVATWRKDGQLLKIEQTTKDAYGVVKGSSRLDFTYYEGRPDCPVDEIKTTEFDALGKEVKRPTVKHFTDGRQPILIAQTKQPDEQPMGEK